MKTRKQMQLLISDLRAELEKTRNERHVWWNANQRQIVKIRAMRAALNLARASLESILANIRECHPDAFKGSTGAIVRMLKTTSPKPKKLRRHETHRHL